MMTVNKLAATAIIGVGGALTGAIPGLDLGPLTLELSREYLALLGAAGGGLFALTGCCIATEHAQARAKNKKQLARLSRIAALAAFNRPHHRMVNSKV